MNALLAFLGLVRRTTPPWAGPWIGELEEFVTSLQDLPATTVAVVLACAVVLYAAKAFVLAALGVFLGAHWLMAKFTNPPPASAEGAP
jgi:hypothetical protein